MKYLVKFSLALLVTTSANTTLQAKPISGAASSELGKLFSSSNAPRSFKFCDADKKTGRCKNGKGLRAVGLGGAFIPLGLEVKGFRIVNRTDKRGNTILATKFDTSVNGIAPKCKDTSLTIPNQSSKLDFKGFYCNWLAIGNVVARVTLDVEEVNARRKTFSGRYTLRLVGTGNMFGKGSFIAKAN